MENINYDKKALRKYYKAKRKALSVEEKHQKLEGLKKQFDHFKLELPKIVKLYQPMETRNELPVQWLREKIKALQPAALFAYPHCLQNGEMHARIDNADTVWKESAFGVLEPVEGEIIEPHHIDWVIVPLLCFDNQGYRVGYGAGFYDRYLKLVSPQCKTIGLSWFPPVEKIEGIYAGDVAIKYCITPEAVYAF